MVLEDALVIVHHGQVWCWLDVEVVSCPGVVVVVDDGGQEETEYLQVWHPVLQPGLRDDPVTALQHVSRVQVVVIRVAIPRTKFSDQDINIPSQYVLYQA